MSLLTHTSIDSPKFVQAYLDRGSSLPQLKLRKRQPNEGSQHLLSLNRSQESQLNQSKTTMMSERRNIQKLLTSPTQSVVSQKQVNQATSAQIQQVNFHQIMIEQNNPEHFAATLEKLSKLEDDKRNLFKLKLMLKTPNKLEIYDTLQQIIQTDYNYQLQSEKKYHIEAFNLLAALTYDFGDYQKALFFNKQILALCQHYRDFNSKLKAYYRVARCYMLINEFDKASSYLKKMLKLSWLQENQDYEIITYDVLGKICYFKQMLVHAKYFHDRCVNGICEPKDSPIRQLGETSMRAQMSQQSESSDDDFDLDMFTNLLIKEDNSFVKARIPKPPKAINKNSAIRKSDLRVLAVGFGVRQNAEAAEYLVPEKPLLQRPIILAQKSLNRHLENFNVQRFLNRRFWSKDLKDEMQRDNIKHYQVRKRYTFYQKQIQSVLQYLQQATVEVYFHEYKHEQH